MSKKIYYTIPSNEKGNFPSLQHTRKDEAIRDAKNEFKELSTQGYSYFRVDVFEGTEEDYDASIDPVFSITSEN